MSTWYGASAVSLILKKTVWPTSTLMSVEKPWRVGSPAPLTMSHWLGEVPVRWFSWAIVSGERRVRSSRISNAPRSRTEYGRRLGLRRRGFNKELMFASQSMKSISGRAATVLRRIFGTRTVLRRIFGTRTVLRRIFGTRGERAQGLGSREISGIRALGDLPAGALTSR